MKLIKQFVAVLVLLIILLAVYLYLPWSLPPKPHNIMLIAHRGVHQNFPFDNVENDTCTARLIYPPKHEYFENTIASMRKAFEYGADMVEIDIHPTTDNQLAVFHDWTIDCRTEGHGVTHEHSMSYLKTLDIGYGYTPDNGKTFPLRGKGIGLMPTFEEVMQEFPDKKFAVNQKDTFDRTVDLLATSLQKYPKSQKNIYFFSSTSLYERLHKQIPQVNKILPSRKEEMNCIPQYLQMLLTGSLNKECKQYAIGLPARFLKYVPGWPHLFLHKAHQAGLEVYITDVDSAEEYNLIKDLPVNGITTNKIEILGPLMNKDK